MEKICIVLFMCLVFVNTEVTVENGGYNVLVSFSQNIDAEDGEELIENMKVSLQGASEVLSNAIGLQFTKVTFNIPNSWNTVNWSITTEDSGSLSSTKADFVIDGTNDVVFGKFPFAQQYGRCGTPGLQIIIPTDFFHEANTFPKEKTLAREWLKYRYGVFDENGYLKDLRYPLYYAIPGSDSDEVKINECTNEPVTYNFIDRNGKNCSENDKSLIELLNSNECSIKPDEENLENVISSLMYFQEDISTMQHICGKNSDHLHNSRSPNKHNALCSGSSVWEIVKKSEDFQIDTTSEPRGDIEYVYVKETKSKVVLALENTKKIEAKREIILASIKKFVYDLPDGSKFSYFPFENTRLDEKIFTMKELNELSDKEKIMGGIKADFLTNVNGDINIAISKALDILSSDSSNPEPEGTIIIIAKSGGTPDETLNKRLQKSKVCVRFLYFIDGAASEEVTKYVSALPCGFLEVVSMTEDAEDAFAKLFAAMERVLPESVDDKVTETVKSGYLSETSPFTFQIDESVETVTFWMFSDRQSSNFELKFEGRNANFGVITDTAVTALSFSPTTGGRVEFSFPHEADPILTQVRITSRAGKYLRGHIFVHDTSEKESPDQMPVIIYALLRYGAYPVQNAKVSATIRRPNQPSVTLEMNDDGKGDPDITQDDGIYSRYFTQFSEKGEYTVTVTVKSDDLTCYGIDQNAGYQSCCGSFVKAANWKIPRISKVFQTTFTARNGRPANGYKPSRILDFRIDQVTDDKVVLKWTAPGEEGDSGTVKSYEIKRFTAPENAMNDFQNGISIFNDSLPPKSRGGDETFDVKLSDFEGNGLYYIAIRANTLSQISDISNIVEVFIPDPDQKTTTVSDKETEDEGNLNTGGTKQLGLIIGLTVGVVVLVIIIYLVVYFTVIKPRRKKETKENPVNHTTTGVENNVLNPINFISADTLLKHHKEKTRAKIENKESPIYNEEDFEENNSSTNESGDNNNAQQQENSDKTLSNEQSLPPKSPKRTTYV